MVFLFTDFGAGDLYVGQVKMVLQQQMRAVAVIDLLHEAPAFNMRASAHLLAALAPRVFADAAAGAVFWYENSLGLVEIAASSAHAVPTLGLKIGQSFEIATP